MGVELDQGKIIECVRRGVPVIQSNLDGALRSSWTTVMIM